MRRALTPAAEFRRKAHARLADVARRFARARLHARFAWLCLAEADALAGQRLAPPTEQERHLRALADQAAARSRELAPEQTGSFHDFAFGGPT